MIEDLAVHLNINVVKKKSGTLLFMCKALELLLVPKIDVIFNKSMLIL